MRVLSFDVGIRHLAFVDIERADAASAEGDAPLRIHRWEVLDMGSKLRGCDVPPAVIRTLDDHVVWSDNDDASTTSIVHYDTVLLENQPVLKNPVMKTVQVALHTYFCSLATHVGNVGDVRLVSATRKGRLRHAPPAEAAAAAAPDGPATAGAKYRTRKADAVRTCAHYLQHVLHDDARLQQLQAAAKKDDLSDCLLQALWYLESSESASAPASA